MGKMIHLNISIKKEGVIIKTTFISWFYAVEYTISKKAAVNMAHSITADLLCDKAFLISRRKK